MNLGLKTVVPLSKVLRASLSGYEKSISDDPAFLISKVQPCPTSSGSQTYCTCYTVSHSSWSAHAGSTAPPGGSPHAGIEGGRKEVMTSPCCHHTAVRPCCVVVNYTIF